MFHVLKKYNNLNELFFSLFYFIFIKLNKNLFDK